MASEREKKSDGTGGAEYPMDPCSSPGVCGSAVTGLLQMLLGAGSITAGVLFLLIDDNALLPIVDNRPRIGVPIWGGAMVSGVEKQTNTFDLV